MTKRPALAVTAPEFGEWLKTLRGQRSLESVAIRLRPLVEPVGLKLNRTSIDNFEKGRIPSWPIVAAIARCYDQPLADVMLRLAQSIQFNGSRDLICPPSTTSSGLSKGAHADAVAAAAAAQTDQRIQELEGKVFVYEAILATARSLTTELAAALSVESDQGPDTAPRRRKRTGTNR